MKLKIHDYNDKWKTVDIGNLDGILSIIVRELSGDEVLTVVRDNGTAYDYDSSDDRVVDYEDDFHIVFVDGKKTDEEWFRERTVVTKNTKKTGNKKGAICKG